MSNLRQRWFEDPLIEEEQERRKIGDRWAKQRNFVNDPWLNEEFIPRLESSLQSYEPKPGPHEEMLHETGVRAGLLLVKGWIEQYRRNVKEIEKNV